MKNISLYSRQKKKLRIILKEIELEKKMVTNKYNKYRYYQVMTLEDFFTDYEHGKEIHRLYEEADRMIRLIYLAEKSNVHIMGMHRLD